MLDVVIAILVCRFEMLVYHLLVVLWFNIVYASSDTVPINERHDLDDTPDLFHTNVWMRMAKRFFIAPEVILEYR